MQARELTITGAFEFTPPVFPDERGSFVAPFQESALVEAIGHPLRVAQTNHSVSARGVVRGVHFADVPPGQAKYVWCGRGALLDVVVDVRVGSPTFGRWEAIRLDASTFRSLYLAEGLGHAIVALEPDTEMVYLCSEGYRPRHEHGVDPTDPALNLPWHSALGDDSPLTISAKDSAAPTLAEAEATGLLPAYSECMAYYQHLRQPSRPSARYGG